MTDLMVAPNVFTQGEHYSARLCLSTMQIRRGRALITALTVSTVRYCLSVIMDVVLEGWILVPCPFTGPAAVGSTAEPLNASVNTRT